MKIFLRIVFFALALLSALKTFSQTNKPLEVRSPNGRVQIKFALNDSQAPTYSVLYDKRTIIADSSLGIEFKQGEYKITQYADGADAAAQPTHVDVTTKEVSAHDKLTVKLAPSGGYAARIESLNE